MAEIETDGIGRTIKIAKLSMGQIFYRKRFNSSSDELKRMEKLLFSREFVSKFSICDTYFLVCDSFFEQFAISKMSDDIAGWEEAISLVPSLEKNIVKGKSVEEAVTSFDRIFNQIHFISKNCCTEMIGAISLINKLVTLNVNDDLCVDVMNTAKTSHIRPLFYSESLNAINKTEEEARGTDVDWNKVVKDTIIEANRQNCYEGN